MAKKDNAIYAPGELSRVRDNLGVKDNDEAKRMAQVLGGEVGTERNPELEAAKNKNLRHEIVELVVGKKGKRRRIDVAGNEEDDSFSKSVQKTNVPFPGDDPVIPVRQSYRERVKMDKMAGQLTFEIKTSFQVLSSIFSFFTEPSDNVNPRFVTKRLNEYYNKIEQLVMSSRSLFPKNNIKRNTQLKRMSPFVYKLLDILRNWNIENIAKNISYLQSRPRSVKTAEFADILRDIYKPLFILEDLNIENIKSGLKLVYKILYVESPMEAKGKYQDIIRNIISSLINIRRNVHYGMYPLLMKLISNRFMNYDRLFYERRLCFMSFLNVTESEQLKAEDLNPQQIESMDIETIQKKADEEEGEGTEEGSEGNAAPEKEEDLTDPKVIARKAREEAEKAERKALDQSRSALETLFPKAGWDKLDEYPDLYPYFTGIYSIRHGYELISPSDPLQQIAVLMHILDDIFIALRYVNFGTITNSDGRSVKVNDELGEIINNWRAYIEDSFTKEYLPRLSEYCRMLDNSKESRTSVYAKKNMNELHWIKRLYFLPFYKFESLGPPPFHKQDIVPIFSQIRKLRKFLISIAVGIEQGTRAGGAAAKAQCPGINNPWEAYNFQVPNPVSRRMDLMLPPERRINATLIFFSLSTIAILDFIVNNENSWSYNSGRGPLFRSVKDEGIVPLFGVDTKIDADQIFKNSLKKT
jgi:hypothetical protein